MAVDVQTDIVIHRPVDEVSSYAADPANAPTWYVNIASMQWRSAARIEVGSQMTFTARFLGRTSPTPTSSSSTNPTDGS